MLAISWQDGSASRLGADILRHASRASSEVRRQADGVGLVLQPDITVDAVDLIGNYAVRLTFSDGHDRGIYPWSYLRELAGLQAA